MSGSYLVQTSVNGPWIPATAMDSSRQWFQLAGRFSPLHRKELIQLKLA